MCWASLVTPILIGKGGIVGSITAEIDKARADRNALKTNEERIAADQNIAELEAKRSVLVADAQAGDRTDSLTRALLVSPVIVLLWKILVYDLALGEWTHGRTDAVPAELWTLITWMIAFYFAHSIITRK